MNEFRDWDLDELVGYIATEEWGVPVRAMEAVLERGAAAVEPLVAVLEEGVGEEEDTDPRFWAVVVLGELRDSRAAPALAEVIRHAGAGDIAISFAAAEALAKLGAPALPALRSLAAYGARHQRHWALYAAGQIDDDAVFAWLLEALQTDHEMADVIALALSDQGRPEAVQPILQALETAEAWQRPELEDALLHLHGLRTGGKEAASDWRLRYRWQPGLGFFPLNWATVSAVVEHQDRQALRGRAAPPPRPLDEILEEARREQEAPERCDCCDTPTWMGTGVPVCPQTTAGVSFLQARMLEQMAEEEDLHDLFDMLDEVEGRLARAELETGRASPAARRRRENLSTSLRILLAGCYWLIEQGVETVGQGVVRLQAEAERAAEAHGTPLPLPRHSTASSAIGAPPLPAAPRAGRNEPCPCGSGRKFKKCCGSAGG